jgi:hypothetical protein
VQRDGSPGVLAHRDGRLPVLEQIAFDDTSNEIRIRRLDRHVYWMKDGKETSSDFSEFSADGRTMLLQPAEDVPRREYRRC